MAPFGMITTTSKYHFLLLLLFFFSSCKPTVEEVVSPEEDKVPNEPYLAFAGAEGGGAYTTGGTTGTVLYVVSLRDAVDAANTPGTFRYAVSQNYPRTIVFRVSGVIHLAAPLEIRSGNLTIAGQTAPGDGICLADYPVSIHANNVIMRFIRIRMGDKTASEGDALTCKGCKDILIDHCSFSWSTDECVSCYANENFTLQYCFITESLRQSVHLKGGHGYGGIWGGKNATFHHNLLAHHDSRNPRFDHDYVDNTCKGPIDHVNNVIYNWGGNSCYGGEGVDEARKINMIANYYKAGPATKKKNRIVEPTHSCGYCSEEGNVVPALFYVADNYVDGYADVTTDNWLGVQPRDESVKEQCRATQPWTLNYSVATQTAEAAYEKVLAVGGASLVRDAVDTRIVEEVRDGKYTYTGSNGSTKGLIDSQEDVGGWPTYTMSAVPADSDTDGMPDDWEVANGLDPKNREDAQKRTLNYPYTNFETYLNGLVAHLY